MALASLMAANAVEAAPATLSATVGKVALGGLTSGAKAAATTATIGGISVLKWGIVTVVAAIAIVTGGVVAQKAMSNEAKQPAAVVQPAPPVPAPEVKPKGQALAGRVLLPDGKPAPGAAVKLYYFHDASG
jgi:hypothetical protein